MEDFGGADEGPSSAGPSGLGKRRTGTHAPFTDPPSANGSSSRTTCITLDHAISPWDLTRSSGQTQALLSWECTLPTDHSLAFRTTLPLASTRLECHDSWAVKRVQSCKEPACAQAQHFQCAVVCGVFQPGLFTGQWRSCTQCDALLCQNIACTDAALCWCL